jgi:hypothetical protein
MVVSQDFITALSLPCTFPQLIRIFTGDPRLEAGRKVKSLLSEVCYTVLRVTSAASEKALRVSGTLEATVSQHLNH